MRRATIDDVAKAAGVSTFTVSRALRGMEHVAASTRDKVLKAAEELNYTASRSASSLASGRTNRVALLARERIGGWFMGELMDGLYDELRPAGYDLTVYRAGSTSEREAFFTGLPTNRNADALIVTGFSATEEESTALTRMGMPIVAVNSPNIEFTQASLAIDDETSEASIVRYLAAIGHRRFCYIGRLDPLTGSQWGYDMRELGYRAAIAELGLTDCGMHHLDIDDMPRSAVQTVAQILAQPQRPTAVCVWSDGYALPVLRELERTGLRVPQDISVFGFDGSDVAQSVGLSTMAQPARETGRMTARITLDLIDGKALDQRQIVVPTTLRPAFSSGPAPVED